MEQVKGQMKYSRNYLKEIIYNNKTDNLDSIYFHLGGRFVHFKLNSEYVSLKYGGKLNLISNDTLRYNLVNFYEFYYILYQEFADGHKKFISDEIRPYFQNHFPSDTTNLLDQKLVKLKLKDRKFTNLINDQMGSYDQINERIDIVQIDSLMSMITRELRNNITT